MQILRVAWIFAAVTGAATAVTFGVIVALAFGPW